MIWLVVKAFPPQISPTCQLSLSTGISKRRTPPKPLIGPVTDLKSYLHDTGMTFILERCSFRRHVSVFIR